MRFQAYNLEDRDVTTDNNYPENTVLAVASNYFTVMNVRWLKAAYFNESDDQNSLQVAVIDKHLADIIWEG